MDNAKKMKYREITPQQFKQGYFVKYDDVIVRHDYIKAGISEDGNIIVYEPEIKNEIQ